MTTPNIDLYLPKTYIFERKTGAYAEALTMIRQDTGLDYIYLPKGMSTITVTQTAMGSAATLGVWLHGPGGYAEQISETVKATNGASRVWAGSLSNPAEGNLGFWLKLKAQYVTTASLANGSVSVQVVNFPPEA